jgi:hypothetical protein
MSVTEIVQYNPQDIELEPVDDRDADLMLSRPTHLQSPENFAGISAYPFPEKAQQILAANQIVPDDYIEIRPDDGNIYMSHIHYRRILNEAFGYGGWAVRPVSDFNVERHPKTDRNGKDFEHVVLYREYQLFVHGRFVSQTMSSGDYYTNNAKLNYSDAAEICQSNAIMRLCKTLGLASNCWMKSYASQWKRKYAVQREGKWFVRDNAFESSGGGVTSTPSGAPAKTDSPSASQPAVNESTGRGAVAPSPRPPQATESSPTPEPQRVAANDDPASGALYVTDVEQKSKPKVDANGKPKVDDNGTPMMSNWFVIHLTDGRKFNTFSKTFANTADEAQTQNLPVIVKTSPDPNNKRFQKLDDLTLANG